MATRTVGLRCPDDDEVRRIARRGRPACHHQREQARPEPPCTPRDEVVAALGDIPVLDGGVAHRRTLDRRRRQPNPLRVLRQGAIVID